MTPRPPASPWLGGPGARWAQILLLAIHIALLVSLVILVFTLADVRRRFLLERWQEITLWAVIALSFVVFARRAWRIGQDLWHAARGSGPNQNEDSEA
jgi:hypothetical protein